MAMAGVAAREHNYDSLLAKPLHIQQLEAALSLEPFMKYVEGVLSENIDDLTNCNPPDTETELLKSSLRDESSHRNQNGITISKYERKEDKTRLYNFSKVKKSRRWIRNILLSDTSSDEDDDKAMKVEDMHFIMNVQKHRKKHQMKFYQDPDLRQYQYYSTGLLSNFDKYPEHSKSIVGHKKKLLKEQKKAERKAKAKLKRLKNSKHLLDEDGEEIDPSVLEAILAKREKKEKKPKKLTPEQADAKRRKMWISIAKKEIPRAQKQKASARKEMLATMKKISTQAMRECRRAALSSQKSMKETPSRARRLTREMLIYWKRFEKVEKEHRKRAEKEALEQRKLDIELKEAKRQQRKLNFLITQTELYAHFMARKITGEGNERKEKILSQLDERNRGTKSSRCVNGGVLEDELIDDDYDGDAMKQKAIEHAESAYNLHQSQKKAFDSQALDGLSEPTLTEDANSAQPEIFNGKLKGYQLKGMNWIANLYNQGINGILADEMGLGKTVQSIAFLTYLAEVQNIWGPFLVVAPASTLHNWQQEVAKFCPQFKLVPYWGNTQDRKILRKFWDNKSLHTEDASFHVVITSYQLVVQDVKYFQRIKWQYMVLDEAQAIKSTSSARWKILLDFNCRNRLLLTGTPIQNSMAELWALLHFIMPTMFDSHDEFNEWFSKDIESHAEKASGIDENQLSRLHMILKPFMLRRVKKDVENELGDKIEILVYCPLTTRQRMLYKAIKNKISIEDLLYSTSSSSSSSTSSSSQSSTSSLMNIVMQFRKVCNHPELFERNEPKSSLHFCTQDYNVPKLIYREGFLESSFPSRDHIVFNKLYIFTPDNIHRSLFGQPEALEAKGCQQQSCFSFSRLLNMSPSELHAYMYSGLLVRWLGVFLLMKAAYRIHQRFVWEPEKSFHVRDCLSVSPLHPASPARVCASPVLSELVFTGYTSRVISHETVVLHYIPETFAHRQIRLRRLKQQREQQQQQQAQGGKKNPLSPPHSPTKSPSASASTEDIILPLHPHKLRPERTLKCQAIQAPRFFSILIPKVTCPSRQEFTPDRSAQWDVMRRRLCGNLEAQQSLMHGNPESAVLHRCSSAFFNPVERGGLTAVVPRYGWTHVQIPDKESLVSDAGKLYVLDSLLQRLKDEDHRVLIYSQMTKMIDLLEEYMWYRKHTYMRLDGSSKISERRDMVADFQTRKDIFVFLLSTRAGGLGINLTAADTVIFYDSDWNPTVDQQAMDRAHRLGQTKQVTVYRLICKGTIEERILERAKEKGEIQKMVISGGNYKPDSLKPKEVVSLLIDDDEMEKKLLTRQFERMDDPNMGTIFRKRKREYKKREGTKKKKEEKEKQKKAAEAAAAVENNITIPAPDTECSESLASRDSMSMPASPMSGKSVCSESLSVVGGQQEDSNDGGLVIVDDAHSLFPPVSSKPIQPPKRGRGRGRPRGSGVGRRPRGRGGAKKAMSAAEIAGAQAGMTAAYAAYGYNFTGKVQASKPADTPNS